ncbi:HAD-IA family hydrolase [Halorussus salilacus]|uniref:HAD family hydrolase n=1 Tax=Halorussus salilacus TaxID=2953750 RepID=UPI00209FFAD3|nr:HAD-IA family hydrolase [Halorussus salilacus]USZ67746.1 HAD-IA family hydrolase [Halorussus salilacus]
MTRDDVAAAESAAAVVYDLDGTLVDLVVDWAAVERRLADLLEREGIDADPLSAWELLDAAEAAGVGEAADDLIAAAERDGARASDRLRRADELLAREIPVGVCSLNREDAVRIALDAHDLAAHVESVVGRGTVPERKPHPRPLLAAVEALGVAPEEVVFVGDSARDEETAERAGTRFEWV